MEKDKGKKKAPVTQKQLKSERMKRFLSMTADTLPAPKKKVYACEKDLCELKKPVDRLRCQNCGVLYETRQHALHQQQCKVVKEKKPKFGCTVCNFTHFDKSEVEAHIKTEHAKDD